MDVKKMLRRMGETAPVAVNAFVSTALYWEQGGFYADGGSAGRRGDFITSPEVGPLFGMLIGRWLDREWDAAGRPDRFDVVEVGAGPGTLARTVVAGKPECLEAMRYSAVERSAVQRANHPETVRSLAEAPDDVINPVVVANELFDNIGFDLLERTEQGWAGVCLLPSDIALADCSTIEVDRWVDLAGPAPEAGWEWREVLLSPARDETVEWASRTVPDAPVGARIPDQERAGLLLKELAAELAPQAILALDYCSTTAELAARPQDEWLRTYAKHERGQRYFDAPGSQDITCEVCVDQLAEVHRPPHVSSQADFLSELGIEELVAEGDAIWRERAAIGDLAAMKARSRRREAEALCDPNGLGAFLALEWR